MSQQNLESELPPLKISCTSTDCENGLHCFRQKKRKAPVLHGPCRACGKELVDWTRVHRRDLADVTHTFEALQHERIRHHFWHVPLDEKAIVKARRKGLAQLREDALRRITRSIGAAQPTFDGRQTRMSGDVLCYAQHATACCCRKCLFEWHNIPRGRELNPEEIGYLASLLMLYVQLRLPDLLEQGEDIPRTSPPASPKQTSLFTNSGAQ